MTSAVAHTVTDIASAQAMGKGGWALFGSATAYDGTSHPMSSGILILTDTVFTSLTGMPNSFREGTTNRANAYNYTGAALNTFTFPAGMYLPGNYVAAVIASGTVLIYF